MKLARGSASLNVSHLFLLPALSKSDYTGNESPLAFCKTIRIKRKFAGMEFIQSHSLHLIQSPESCLNKLFGRTGMLKALL